MNKGSELWKLFLALSGMEKKATVWDEQPCMIWISLRPLANPPLLPSSCLFFRESSGALHHGNEPLLHTGAGVPHDLPSPHAQTGSAGADPEESHLPQQELPSFAARSGPAADEEEENMSDPVIRRAQRAAARHLRLLGSGNPLQLMTLLSAET